MVLIGWIAVGSTGCWSAEAALWSMDDEPQVVKEAQEYLVNEKFTLSRVEVFDSADNLYVAKGKLRQTLMDCLPKVQREGTR